MRLAPALLLLLVSVGCASSGHRVAAYRDDPAAAAALEEEAALRCAEKRGPDDLPPRPFTTDGCSAFVDEPWLDCCVEHDMRYWCGGPSPERGAADAEFRACLDEISGFWSRPLWMGVRVGGQGWAPTTWRWGYGWEWPHSQAPEDETSDADTSTPDVDAGPEAADTPDPPPPPAPTPRARRTPAAPPIP